MSAPVTVQEQRDDQKQIENIEKLHPGDLAVEVAHGAVDPEQIREIDQENYRITRLRAGLKEIIEYPEVGAGKVERAGKALQQLPDS